LHAADELTPIISCMRQRLLTTGRQCTVPFSVQKWIISRRRCAMLLNISSEKSKVTRELALVELFLACLMKVL
jgi:hypothetical protein